MKRAVRLATVAALLAAAIHPSWAPAEPVVNPLTDTTVFPIAVWAMPAATAAPFSELGVNLFVAGERNPRGWCDTLAASGCVGFVHWSSRRTPQERAEIVASPGFLGWMHGDEPDNPGVVDDVFRAYNTPPEKLLSAYDQMRGSSTPAPMYLNLGQGLANGINQSTPDSVYPAFCSTADIVCYDVYPTSTQWNGLERLHLAARGVERLRRFAGPDKPLWIWLECTAIHDGDAGIGNRAPLPFEVRAEVWMSIVHGADGIGWFPHQFKPYKGGPDAIPAAVQAEMKLTNGLLHQLAPILRTGRRERLAVRAGDGWVNAAHWRLDDQDLLVVVNMRHESTCATVPLPDRLGALRPVGGAVGQVGGAVGQVGGSLATDASCPCQTNEARVFEGPRRSTSPGGTLDLALRPYEVAILTSGLEELAIDYTYPAPDPQPPSPPAPAVAATLAELPERPANGEGVTWSRTPSSRLTVPRLPAAPKLDGNLTDPAWNYAAPLAPLTNTAGTGVPAIATEARLGRLGDTLYLACRATEPFLDSLVTHYQAGWRNDCIELWLDPDNRRTSFAHLIATADGRLEVARTVQDEWGEGRRDEAWDPRVTLRTGREEGAWTAEIAIALGDLGDAGPGAVWGFDLARERKPGGGENSVWTLGRFNGAGYFGEIAFGPVGPVPADLVPTELVLAGGALYNHTTRPVSALVEVRVSQRREAVRYIDWEDQWVDLAIENRTVSVPAATPGRPGQALLLTGDVASRAPAGGRVGLSLLSPDARQFEEFIANLPAGLAEED